MTTNDDFVVNRKSLHYKLNLFIRTKIGPNDRYYFETRGLPQDFCLYWRMTFFSALWFVLLTLFVGLIVSGIVYQVVTQPLVSAGVVGILIGVILFLFVLCCATEYLKQVKAARREHKVANNIPDGIIVTKYKSWKQKYCPSVRYE